jgi:hypothetical protein
VTGDEDDSEVADAVLEEMLGATELILELTEVEELTAADVELEVLLLLLLIGAAI